MLAQEQRCYLGMNLVTYKEAMARDQEAEEQTTWGPGRRAKHAGDPCSSRWRSTVRAHLMEYTVERNELESDLSSTTAMAVQRTQNGSTAVLRQIQHGIG